MVSCVLPSTFKIIHIFNSNKRKKYKEVEKYSDRVLILNVEGLSKLNRGILNRLHALELLHHLFTVLQIVGHIQNNLFGSI